MFDLERVRRLCVENGYELVFTSAPDEADPDGGIWDIPINPDNIATSICASYSISGFWYVYVNENKAYNEFSAESARDYATHILAAAEFTDQLNAL